MNPWKELNWKINRKEKKQDWEENDNSRDPSKKKDFYYLIQ